ncbi:MAG: c-type cytochrome [Gaiellaceae bacterium]
MRRRSLVAALVVAVALFAAGCGGGDEEAPPEGAPAAQGDPERGKDVFAAQGCVNCHTFEAAGSTATIGPDLDETLQGQSPEEIRESIVNPNAEIAEGFEPGVMPEDFGDKLSDQELNDLVAFLQEGG